jgi:competence protein ComEC
LLAACDRARDPQIAAFLRAVVCGDTSSLDGAALDLFTRTGTRHLLAVSGQHVALIASFVIAPLLALASACARALARGRQRFDPWVAFVALVWIYAPLAGGGSPVRRAALAFALAGAARALTAPREARERGLGAIGRRADALSLWGAALAFECVFDPRAPTELSLQLSYAATLGLILGTRPIARALRELFERREPALELESSWLRAIRARVARTATLALAASFAAVLATLALSWRAFGETSLVGALATVAALPIFGWMLAVGWLSALFPSAMPIAPFEFGARALVGLLELCDRLPGTPIELAPRPAWLLIGASLVSFAALASSRAPTRRRLAASACLAWGLALVPWSAAASELEIYALDVGHGTAIVLRAPGEAAWIYDAGSRDRPRVAQDAIAPLLRDWDVAEIAVVLSHTDRDHAGALPWLGERFRPRRWAGALTDELALRFGASVERVDLDLGSARLASGGSLELTLARGAREEGNEGSRVLVVEVAQGSEAAPRRWILCGDAQERGLAQLLRSSALDGPCEVLLLPHHGASTDLLGRMLDRARPKEVWISSSGATAAERELDRRGIAWRATWRDGVLTSRCACAKR